MQPLDILETQAKKTVSATREKIVRLVNEAFSKNDMNLFLSHCTDDVAWHMIGDKTLQGKDAILQAMTAHPSDCSDITVEAVITEHNKTVGTGSFNMMNKEGVTKTYQYCDVYTFEEDKIAAMDSYVVAVKS